MLTRWKVRMSLLLTLVIGFGVCWWLGGAGVIAADGRSGSLLGQPSPAVAALLGAAGAIAAAVVGVLLLGSVRPYGGVLGASFGLLALAIRGGPMTFVMQAATGKSVFVRLTVELVLLAGVLVTAWWVGERLRPARVVPVDPDDDDAHDDRGPVPIHQTALALGVSTFVCGAVIYLLGQSDDKAQALAAVGIGAYLGTWAACQVGPARAAAWSWASPLVVGTVGYLLATWMPGADWRVDFVRQPLATVTPLDYASIGPALAVLSYWSNRRWATDAEYEDAEPAAQPAPAAVNAGTTATATR